jgi:hypothetical protein
MNDRARRIADNEQRFRVFNDQVREVRVQLDAESGFACECGDATCHERIVMSLEEYGHLRSDRRWFAVVPGHEAPGVERVIERAEGYNVVEKIGESSKLVQ